MKTITVRVDDETYAELCAVAQSEERSISQVVSRIVKRGMGQGEAARTASPLPPSPTRTSVTPRSQGGSPPTFDAVHPLPARDAREPVPKVSGKRRAAAKPEQAEEPDAFEGEGPAGDAAHLQVPEPSSDGEDLFADENEEEQDGNL